MFIITYRKLFLLIGLAIVVSAIGIVAFFGLKPGIDFTGGSLTEVGFATLPPKADVEAALATLNYGEAAVRESTGEIGDSVIITTRTLSVDEQQQLEDTILALDESGTIIRTTTVGPVVGAEMKDKAGWAIAAVLIVTIIYVAFAFKGVGVPVSSWVYGFFTVLVLLHDILVPLAVMCLLGAIWGIEMDVLFVTALLTILGYSVNDTIVIFDRVREKLAENRTEDRKTFVEPGGIEREEVTYTLTKSFDLIVGQAVSETMTRSINTSLTVLLALLALYFFGSSVTQTFVLVLITGVFAGAYSSIFIASPLLVAYEEWQRNRKASNS